jgi:hypothetical protein
MKSHKEALMKAAPLMKCGNKVEFQQRHVAQSH